MKKPATKANIPAKPQKVGYLGALAAEQPVKLVADNMETRDSDLFTDLNFKVRPDFKMEYKITATAAGMSMKELLEESYKVWVENRRAKKD